MTASLTLDVLNATSAARFVQFLDGLYEHSPWVLERTAAKRPFASVAALKYALAQTVREASREEGTSERPARISVTEPPRRTTLASALRRRLVGRK